MGYIEARKKIKLKMHLNKRYSMKKLTYLYLVKFKTLNEYKIGITSNLSGRTKYIHRKYDSIDYFNSYIILLNDKQARNLETTLKNLLHDENVVYSQGSGRTEFFSIGSFNVVLDYINTFIKSYNDAYQLIRFSEYKDPENENQLSDNFSFDNAKLTIDSLNTCNKQLLRLLKIMDYFKKRHATLLYQWDIVGDLDFICFRVIRQNSISRSIVRKLLTFRLGHYSIKYYRLFNLVNSYASEKDLFQFNIDLNHCSEWKDCGNNKETHFQYIANTFFESFGDIPTRSPLLHYDLPILSHAGEK